MVCLSERLLQQISNRIYVQAEHLIAGIDAEHLLGDRGWNSDAIVAQAIFQRYTKSCLPRKTERYKENTINICTS